jgi:hypothetical protein
MIIPHKWLLTVWKVYNFSSIFQAFQGLSARRMETPGLQRVQGQIVAKNCQNSAISEAYTHLH